MENKTFPIFASRSTGGRQLDLLIAVWLCLGAAAVATYLLADFQNAELLRFFEQSALVWVTLFAGGTVLFLTLRWWFFRRDFRFVSDGETFLFLAQPGKPPILLRRVDVLLFSEDVEGLSVHTPAGVVRIEGAAEADLLVHSQLIRWAAQEGRPQDPPHTPPYAR